MISPVPIAELIKHFLFGYSSILAPPFYYLADVIIIYVILYITRKFENRVLWGIVVCCFIFQYSGWNVKLWEGIVIEARITYGRICELLPYAIIGVSCKEGMWRLDKSKKIVLMLSILMGILYVPDRITGFGYQGIILFLGAGALFLLIISAEYKGIGKLGEIAKYSMGIYGAHFGVGRLIEIFLLPNVNIALPQWFVSIIIWIISLGVSIFMSKIHLKKIVQ